MRDLGPYQNLTWEGERGMEKKMRWNGEGRTEERGRNKERGRDRGRERQRKRED